MHAFYNHEIDIKLNLVKKKTAAERLKTGNSITKRTIHIMYAVNNCDSDARKCQCE